MLKRNALKPLAAALLLAVPSAALAAGETTAGAKADAEAAGILGETPDPAAGPGATTASLHEVEDGDKTALWNNLTADEIEDMDIVNVSGETVAEVEETLADPSGKIVAVTAEVGGFLGIGEQEVVVTLDHLALRGGALSTAMTEEDLQGLPVWRN